MGRMMYISRVFMACLLLASLYVGTNAAHGEVEDEYSFSYEAQTEKGPENWGNLNQTWQICKTGQLQSPIDLHDEKAVVDSKLGELKLTHKAAPAVMKNRGHDIMMLWKGDAGGVIINGIEFKLQQCHWHAPSEHTMSGEKLEMELHMVHGNHQGHVAVVSVLYKLGGPDVFLGKFLESVKSATNLDPEKEIELGTVNPWEVQVGGNYYRYMGSLTTPPCTEGVIWTVLQKARTVSKEQTTALKNAVQDGYEENARPTQNLGGRTLYVYRP